MTPDDALLAQAVARGVVPQDLAARARLEAAALAAQGRPIGAVAIVTPHLTAEQAAALRSLGQLASRTAPTAISDRLPGQQPPGTNPSGPRSGRLPRPGPSTPDGETGPRRDSSGRLVGGALRPGDQVGAYVLQEELGRILFLIKTIMVARQTFSKILMLLFLLGFYNLVKL